MCCAIPNPEMMLHPEIGISMLQARSLLTTRRSTAWSRVRFLSTAVVSSVPNIAFEVHAIGLIHQPCLLSVSECVRHLNKKTQSAAKT